MAAYLNYQSVYRARTHSNFNWSAAFVAGTVLFVILAVNVGLKLQSTSLGYVLAEVRQETVLLDTERRDVELQRSVLLQPAGLEERAMKVLYLQPYNSAKVVKIPVAHEVF